MQKLLVMETFYSYPILISPVNLTYSGMSSAMAYTRQNIIGR